MNKLDFLRPKQFSVASRGGSAAFTQKNGLRVNSDGTTIEDRKPHLKLRPNHYRPMIYGRFLFSGGTAISVGDGHYKRRPE